MDALREVKLLKEAKLFKELPKEELFEGGTFACGGCNSILSIKLVYKALGKNTIMINAAGCMTLTATHPYTPHKTPWVHGAIENAAAVGSGIYRGLKAQGMERGVHIVPFAGDGACYSPDTKVFTNSGFKWIPEVTTKDKIWSVNPSTFELELQPVTKLHQYFHEGKMVRAETRYLDFLVTPDHTVPIMLRDSGKMKMINASELLKRYKTLLPRSFKWKGKSQEYFELPKLVKRTTQKEFSKFKIEDWIKLVAWYVTEGSCYKSESGYLVRIYQSNKENRKEILELVKSMGINCCECSRSVDFQSKQIYTYLKENCGDHFYNKRVPKEFLDLNPELLKQIYMTLLKGDGCIVKPGKGRKEFRKTFITKSNYLRDNFVEVCLKLGMSCNISQDERGVFRIGVQEKHIKNELYPTRKFTKDRPQVYEEDYSGMVYCPELPENHTLIIERNGRISLSGNTYDIGFQALSGAVHRKENLIYICYNNCSFANTGFQWSSATPFGANTATSPPGKANPVGNLMPRKNMAKMLAIQGASYVATASTAYPLDFVNKLRKAAKFQGTKFIDVLNACIPGWGIQDNMGTDVSKAIVESGMWPLYEIENKQFKLTHKPKMIPVDKALKMQVRFKHLKLEHIKEIQKIVDKEWSHLNKGDIWNSEEY